jgi:hypothetical protein
MKAVVALVIVCIVCMALALLSPELAMPQTRPAPRAIKDNPYPPHYMTFIAIAKCEQPSRGGGGWHGIAWKQEYNWSFKGGMGMTTHNWRDFKRKGQPDNMARATPVEQLWAAWRLYQWAERTYPGYGWTAWECSPMIGFRGEGTWK